MTKIDYDEEADALYVTFRRAKHVTCDDDQLPVIFRYDPEEDMELVGFTILDFVGGMVMMAKTPEEMKKVVEEVG